MAQAEASKKHRWQKGQSGNPSGRPKNMVNLTAILNEALQDDHIETKTTGKGKNKKTKQIKTNYAVLIIMRMLDMAVAQGNDKMINAIFDRIEGKPVQSVNLGGQAGNPIALMEVDPETQASILAMQNRWFEEERVEKKKVAKRSTTGKPSDNQVTTKPKPKKRVVVIKRKK